MSARNGYSELISHFDLDFSLDRSLRSMSNRVQLQLDLLSGPAQLLSTALSQYQAVRSNRRNVNWSLVTFSPVLRDVTHQSKSMAVASVIDRQNSWWAGRWWCGTNLGPFWNNLIVNQNHNTAGMSQSLLAVALELTSVMSQTESAEVILGLLYPGDVTDNAVVVAGSLGPSCLTIGDVMPALQELEDQGSSIYMADERAKFEEFVIKALGSDVPGASTALYGIYNPTDIQNALEAVKKLLGNVEGSEIEISCPQGAIKLGFFIHILWGISVKIMTTKGSRVARVSGNARTSRHTLSILASVGPKESRLWTPLGTLLSATATYSHSHSIHSETCMEHISTILTRWEHHWGIPHSDMLVFSKCLLSLLIDWRRRSSFSGQLYHKFDGQRLGSITYNKDGYGKKIHGYAIKDVVSNNDLMNVYASCLGEYAISHDDAWALIHEEGNIEGAPYGKTFYDHMFNSTLGRTCHCYKHIGNKQRPNGHGGHCSADDGHSLFMFIGSAMRLLTLVDLEQPEYAIPSESSLTQSFEVFNKRTFGRVYHGQAVRHAVSSLPGGHDQTHNLTWANILQGVAWLFSGQPGGTSANALHTAGVFVNGVAIVGSFCFNMTLSPRDSRVHLSFGKTLYAGSQIARLECYEQNVYGVLPDDNCFGSPRPAQSVRPELVGVDEASSTQMISLRNEIAILALRISWKETRTASLQEVLISPANYLRELAWQVFSQDCPHDVGQCAGVGTIRVARAGVFPKKANFDAQGIQLWPPEYVPSPNLPSPNGFKGCVLLTQGCLELQIAFITQIGAGEKSVLQKDCCLGCACQLAMEVDAKFIICC